MKLQNFSDIQACFHPSFLKGDLLIAGRRVTSPETLDVKTPIVLNMNDQLEQPVLGTLSVAQPYHVQEALKAAESAWSHGVGIWPQMSRTQRLQIGQKFIERFRSKREEVAKSLMWEICKSWTDALGEFDRTLEYLQDTLKMLVDITQSEHTLREGHFGLAQISRLPRGICLVVGPFNYPLNETLSIVWPALMAGNCILIKQPRYGALSWSPFLDDLVDLFPAGSIQILSGSGKDLLPLLLKPGTIHSVSFIGNSKTAHTLLNYHPYPIQLHRLLGLDAKNAAIVQEKVSLDPYIPQILKGALSYNGQRCTALKLIYVHRSQKADLEELLRKQVSQIRCQYPWEDKTLITPMPDVSSANRCVEMIEEAQLGGATILHQGNLKHGVFLDPAVVTDIQPGMRLFEEEQFGPIVAVRYYETLEQIRQEIASSPFGMQVSLFGSEVSWMREAIRQFEHLVCRVNCNAVAQRSPDSFPFTGRKFSAYGSLGLRQVYEELTLPAVTVFSSKDLGQDVLRAGGTHSFSLNTIVL